jgi:iron(III) transport system ATP-binding protein
MNNAVVEQVGTPREIYNKPASPFVAGFIGTMNFFGNKGSAQAIRPEKIKIVDRREEYDQTARITAIEFKGPLTRVYGSIYGSTEICIDMPSQEFDSLNLHEGGTIFMRLPEEYVSRYQDMCADVAV